jgi:choice-of-anchor B domain-containing protein
MNTVQLSMPCGGRVIGSSSKCVDDLHGVDPMAVGHIENTQGNSMNNFNLFTLLLACIVLPIHVATAQMGGIGPANFFHPDEDHGHEADDEDPYVGPGWTESGGGNPAMSFSSHGVTLRSWIPLADFHASATDGNDCWGYTSPSGREYAFIGLNNGTGVAEVTDPANTTVIAHLPGVGSIWRDIKTYQTYAYAVSEGGGGIQVFDLAGIDSGTIVDLGSITTGSGTLKSHNVAINATSGRLYRVGGGSSPIEGLRIYSLANPAVPAYLGSYNTRYCHDVQVVVWNDPPFVGVEVAFCYGNDASGGGSPGVDILNVSNPLNITLIGSIDLSQPPIFSHAASYSHQGWLSPNRRYLYFDDEVDESATGNPTTTRILDIQDLANPVQVGIFTNTTSARDHNLYTKGSLIYQANYRSGLRVLSATNPLALFEIGFFDTYPPDDNPNYNGLWSVYPFFPSGTVIGSDIEKGLFVWSVEMAVPALSFEGLVALMGFIALLGALLTRVVHASR